MVWPVVNADGRSGHPYIAWLQAGAAKPLKPPPGHAAAAAYEAAFAITVPPPAIAANRAQLMALIAPTSSARTPRPSRPPKPSTRRCGHKTPPHVHLRRHLHGGQHLNSYNEPPRTTNETGQSAQTRALAQTTANTTSATPKPRCSRRDQRHAHTIDYTRLATPTAIPPATTATVRPAAPHIGTGTQMAVVSGSATYTPVGGGVDVAALSPVVVNPGSTFFAASGWAGVIRHGVTAAPPPYLTPWGTGGLGSLLGSGSVTIGANTEVVTLGNTVTGIVGPPARRSPTSPAPSPTPPRSPRSLRLPQHQG